MVKKLFCAFVLYLTSKTFPPTFSLNDRRSLKKKVEQLQLKEGQLFCGGRHILLSDETKKHLRDLHEKQCHLIFTDLFYWAPELFIVPYLRFECAEIVANCSTSVEYRIPVRRSGPMLHCLCREIGINWTKHFKTSNHDEIDPSKFKAKLVICPRPYNFVCTTLGVFLTVSIKAASAIQDWVRKTRRGRFSYLYDEYENKIPVTSLDN